MNFGSHLYPTVCGHYEKNWNETSMKTPRVLLTATVILIFSHVGAGATLTERATSKLQPTCVTVRATESVKARGCWGKFAAAVYTVTQKGKKYEFKTPSERFQRGRLSLCITRFVAVSQLDGYFVPSGCGFHEDASCWKGVCSDEETHEIACGNEIIDVTLLGAILSDDTCESLGLSAPSSPPTTKLATPTTTATLPPSSVRPVTSVTVTSLLPIDLVPVTAPASIYYAPTTTTAGGMPLTGAGTTSDRSPPVVKAISDSFGITVSWSIADLTGVIGYNFINRPCCAGVTVNGSSSPVTVIQKYMPLGDFSFSVRAAYSDGTYGPIGVSNICHSVANPPNQNQFKLFNC